jgi:hypothetical protein
LQLFRAELAEQDEECRSDEAAMAWRHEARSRL